MKKISILKSSFLAAAAALFVSCVSDEIPVKQKVVPTTDGSVTFRISVPGVQTPSSRALTEGQDAGIALNDIWVLMFSKDNGDKYVGCFEGKIVGTYPGNIASGGTKIDFDVTLPLGGTYNLMVVANAKSILEEHASDLVGSQTQARIEEALTRSMQATEGWKTGTSPDLLPMWGYATDVDSEDFTFNESTGRYRFRENDPLRLVRMVAKVNVLFGANLINQNQDPTKKKFTLTDVYVYNYNKTGRLIPATAQALAGGMDWTFEGVPSDEMENYLKSKQIISLPPASLGDIKAPDGVSIHRTVKASDNNRLTNELYLFETEAGADPSTGTTDFWRSPCLVIGGKFDGDAEPRYYRVDFAVQKNGKWNHIPLKRNNSYTVIIDGINASGTTTPEEAVKTLPGNVNARVVEWIGPSDITVLFTDEIYMLGLSQDNFIFTKEARTVDSKKNELVIMTDHPGGWTATVSVDSVDVVPVPGNWLTLNRGGVTATTVTQATPDRNTGGTKIDILTTELPTDTPRTAWIHVKAGVFKLIVRVHQRNEYIRITDESDNDITELLFASKKSLIDIAPASRKFTVKWSPAGQPLDIAKTFGENAFTWQNTTTNNMTTVAQGGSYTFTIDPEAITHEEVESDPFITKETTMTFTINGTETSSSIDLKHAHYNLIVEGLTSGFGRMSSVAVIKTNADWKLAVSDPETILTGNRIPPSGQANTIGTFYTYTFGGATGDADFAFTPQNPGQFDPVDITISGGSIAPLFARSNVVLFDNKTAKILTFAETEEHNKGTKIVTYRGVDFVIEGGIPANVQGMHFMWGSLVAISSQSIDFDTGQIRFYPTEFTKPSGNWVYPHTTGPNNTPPWNMGNIPYVTTASANGTDHDAFVELFGAKGYDAAAGKGDVCRYISDKRWVEGDWRLPTSDEWRMLYAETTNRDIKYGMIPTIGTPTPSQMTVNPAYTTTSDGSIKWGFFRLPHARLLGAGVVTSDSGNQSGSLLSPGKDRLLLPASGYRNYDDGNLAFVGQTGYFWTSTPAIDPADNGESYLMFIYDNGNVDSRLNDHRYGFAVRCIQNYNNR